MPNCQRVMPGQHGTPSVGTRSIRGWQPIRAYFAAVIATSEGTLPLTDAGGAAHSLLPGFLDLRLDDVAHGRPLGIIGRTCS